MFYFALVHYIEIRFIIKNAGFMLLTPSEKNSEVALFRILQVLDRNAITP